MIEEYVKEIKQCADHIITNNRIIDSRIKECIVLLDQNAEELTNGDIEFVKGVLRGLVD